MIRIQCRLAEVKRLKTSISAGRGRLRRSGIRLLAWTVVLVAGLCLPFQAAAENATGYTYTLSARGYTRMQDAYLPGAILLSDIGMSMPEDLNIRGDWLYVADSGNRRIVKYNLLTRETIYLGEEILQNPTGVYVDGQERIYVADYSAQVVYRFGPDGELQETYGRPTETVFGTSSTYLPKKVAVSHTGDIYIVSEGGFDGIINLNSEGGFMGYFGFNYTRISLWDALMNQIFTDAQKQQVLTQKPMPFYNLNIDEDGIVYTVTQNVQGNALKKHDISGANMIYFDMVDETNFTGVCVGSYGQMYAVTQSGLIFEYDPQGTQICTFGGKASSTERLGYFTTAADIDCDENDCLYILDRERSLVQVFYPTEFITGIHQAIRTYENGEYSASQQMWSQIINRSGGTTLAYEYMAKTYFQAQDYEMAAQYAELASDRQVYSDAFWEIRNRWMLQYIGIVIGVVVLLAAAWCVYRAFHPKKAAISLDRQLMTEKNTFIQNFTILPRFLRHPVDTFYYVRRDKCGSVVTASILYAVAFVVFTADMYFRGFVFNNTLPEDRNVGILFLLFVGALGLWTIGNYMVSSISEGEGRFRDVYIATAYSLTPLILFMPFVILASYVVTINEAFLLEAATVAIWIWCALLACIGMKEIHNYTIREVVKTILITLFFMAVVVIVGSILYMFWDQLIEFLYSVGKEASYRVTS